MRLWLLSDFAPLLALVPSIPTDLAAVPVNDGLTTLPFEGIPEVFALTLSLSAPAQ